MDAEIPLPMCANLYQYQICIPELKGKCQEEKKEKLMVRIGETNPINQTQLFLQTRGQNGDFLAEGPHRFNLLGKLRAFAFNKRASCNGYMNGLKKSRNWLEFKLEINCRPQMKGKPAKSALFHLPPQTLKRKNST